jgi:hypothetical protein
MAVFYYDPQYPAYNAIPTWNIAQEGDGTSKALAVPAIASIVVSGACTAGNTLTIMGVTLTAVASGATAAQFNVGASATLQADNIATAINAATAEITAGFSATRPQLRDILYARSPASGAPANTVEIMTRVGSAIWNGITSNTAVAPALTLTQFSGGVGGSAGYMGNNGTIWKSARTKCMYGLVYGLNTSLGASTFGNMAGLAMGADNDICHVRANGSTMEINKTDHRLFARGTFIVDDGTIWPGDTGTFTIEKNAASGSAPVGFSNWGAGKLVFTARDRTRAIFSNTNTAGGEQIQLVGNINSTTSTLWQIDNFTFSDTNANAAGIILFGSSYRTVAQQVVIFTNNVFTSVKAQYTLISLGTPRASSLTGGIFKVSGLDVAFPTFVGTGTYLANVDALAPGAGNGTQIVLENINYTASPSAVAPYIIGETALTSNAMPYGSSVIVKNVTGCKPANNVGLLGIANSNSRNNNSPYILQQNIDLAGTRYTKLETNGFVREISSASDMPTLSSTLLSGAAVGGSFDWAGSLNSNAIPVSGVSVIEVTLVATVSGLTTITLNLLIEPALVGLLNKSLMQMTVAYIDTSGTIRFKGIDYTAVAVLPTGAGLAGWDKKAYTTYVPCQLSVTLPSIAINTEVDVSVMLLNVNPLASGSVSKVFYDPSLVVT